MYFALSGRCISQLTEPPNPQPCPQPVTRNSEPATRNPQPVTRNSEPATRNSEPNHYSGASSFAYGDVGMTGMSELYIHHRQTLIKPSTTHYGELLK